MSAIKLKERKKSSFAWSEKNSRECIQDLSCSDLSMREEGILQKDDNDQPKQSMF
jgi:hypothetical protein